MKRLLQLALLLASFMASAQVADDYIIIIESNTVSSDGQLRWRCEKNGVTVVAAVTSQFETGASNDAIDPYLAEQLQKCRDANAGTVTEKRESHSKPVEHGSTEHDGTVASLSGGFLTSTEFAAANKQFTKDISLFTPATSDSNLIQLKYAQNVTLQRISCSTDTGTVTIQFDERAEATPNTAGTNVLTSSLVCDTNTEASTAFTNAGIALDVPLNLQITATTGTPGVVRIHAEAQID